MKSFLKVIIGLSIAIFAISGRTAFGQTQIDPCKKPPEDFLDLADLRGQLKNEIVTLEEEIRTLPDRIERVKDLERKLEDADQKLKDLKQKKTATQIEVTSQETLKNGFITALGGANSANLEADLANKKNQLQQKQDGLRCTEKSISAFFSPEQKFKTWVSLFFATLIGLVILGFFALATFLAFRQPQMISDALFGGQAGLQFLTLFSLVIAIILFGIINILQDKELAALLGGLSGYILGRSTMPPRQALSGAPPTKPSLPSGTGGPSGRGGGGSSTGAGNGGDDDGRASSSQNGDGDAESTASKSPDLQETSKGSAAERSP